MTPEREIVRCRTCGSQYEAAIGRFSALAEARCPACGAMNFVSRYQRIDIGLSEACNLSCLMCRRPQEKEALSTEYVLSLLRDASAIGVRTVSFSGGEPFIHPGIRTILRAALDLSFKIELVTNGTLVKADDIGLLERLKCVTVSVDGPAAEHDFIRGRAGAWKRTIRTVELLAASSATWGTNTVMQRPNADVLYHTWRGIREHGRPSYVGFTHVEVVPETRHLLIPREQLAAAREQVLRIRRECVSEGIHFNDGRIVVDNFDVFSDKNKRYRPAQGCSIPRLFMGITAYGYFPCWHQGRYITAPSLIEALQDPLCDDIIREGMERRCVGCNAANYSWSEEWIEGILESHDKNDYEQGLVHLSQAEREAGSVRPGRRTLPLLERAVADRT